jgi:hypothetical protein
VDGTEPLSYPVAGFGFSHVQPPHVINGFVRYELDLTVLYALQPFKQTAASSAVSLYSPPDQTWSS